jgi:hypothetical protein
MKRPRIRLSRLTGLFVCHGNRCTGSGNNMRDAWHAWEIEMILKGQGSRVPKQKVKP